MLSMEHFMYLLLALSNLVPSPTTLTNQARAQHSPKHSLLNLDRKMHATWLSCIKIVAYTSGISSHLYLSHCLQTP